MTAGYKTSTSCQVSMNLIEKKSSSEWVSSLLYSVSFGQEYLFPSLSSQNVIIRRWTRRCRKLSLLSLLNLHFHDHIADVKVCQYRNRVADNKVTLQSVTDNLFKKKNAALTKSHPLSQRWVKSKGQTMQNFFYIFNVVEHLFHWSSIRWQPKKAALTVWSSNSFATCMCGRRRAEGKINYFGPLFFIC